jgi:hypothetical protein
MPGAPSFALFADGRLSSEARFTPLSTQETPAQPVQSSDPSTHRNVHVREAFGTLERNLGIDH